MENENPVVYESVEPRIFRLEDDLDEFHDDIDSREIFGQLYRSKCAQLVKEGKKRP